MTFPDFEITQTVTVGAGASLSGASAICKGYHLIGLITAATWDAAKITFQASMDGTNFFVLTKEGTEYEVASITGAKAVALDWIATYPWNYFKVQSGTSGAAVNQADATIVTLVYG